MKAKLLSASLLTLLSGLWFAGPARAADVELWEGESATRSQTKTQVVRNSATATSSKPDVATVSKPKGDNLQVTITGVKEGEATITIKGKRVVYNVGVNQNSIRTEEPFEAFIDVVVKKVEVVEKKLVIKKKERGAITFPKNMSIKSKTLKNSNKAVCSYNRNTSRKLTVTGKRKGTSTITMQLNITEKGKTRRVKGIVHVEVTAEKVNPAKKYTSIGWDALPAGKAFKVNGGGEMKGKKPKKEKEEKNEKKKKEEMNKKPKRMKMKDYEKYED